MAYSEIVSVAFQMTSASIEALATIEVDGDFPQLATAIRKLIMSLCEMLLEDAITTAPELTVEREITLRRSRVDFVITTKQSTGEGTATDIGLFAFAKSPFSDHDPFGSMHLYELKIESYVDSIESAIARLLLQA